MQYSVNQSDQTNKQIWLGWMPLWTILTHLKSEPGSDGETSQQRRRCDPAQCLQIFVGGKNKHCWQMEKWLQSTKSGQFFRENLPSNPIIWRIYLQIQNLLPSFNFELHHLHVTRACTRINVWQNKLTWIVNILGRKNPPCPTNPLCTCKDAVIIDESGWGEKSFIPDKHQVRLTYQRHVIKGNRTWKIITIYLHILSPSFEKRRKRATKSVTNNSYLCKFVWRFVQKTICKAILENSYPAISRTSFATPLASLRSTYLQSNSSLHLKHLFLFLLSIFFKIPLPCIQTCCWCCTWWACCPCRHRRPGCRSGRRLMSSPMPTSGVSPAHRHKKSYISLKHILRIFKTHLI